MKCNSVWKTGKCLFPVLFFLLTSTDLFSQTNYFYSGKTYGSEALYNPVSLILNGSFDIIQFEDLSRKFSQINFRNGYSNVNRNIFSPFSNIAAYGWGNFIKTEVLPIEFKRKNAQWWPNYQLHLIGGGMTFAAMEEWYQLHGFTYPKTASAATVFIYHYLNEVVENNNYQGTNVDPISDIYLFDLGGALLFSSDKVKRFFSKSLHLRDWSLQPAYTPATGELHNNGQYFSVKWFFHPEDTYGLFYYFGINGITGVSYRVTEQSTISLGGGLRAKKQQAVEGAINQKTVKTVWTAGAFWDKNGSLMSSVFFSGLSDYFINLNIYPGVLPTGELNTGLWVALHRKGSVAFGFNILGFPGLGHSTMPVK